MNKYNRASAKRSEGKQIHHDLTFWQSEFDNDDPMHLYLELYELTDEEIDDERNPAYKLLLP